MINKIYKRKILRFTQELTILLRARMTLLDSLELLAKQENNLHFQKIQKSIIKSLENGQCFSESLAKYPKLFDQFYVNLIRVGELTGQLDDMLLRISSYLGKIEEVKRKSIQAISYPVLVILISVLCVGFLLIYVIPTFSEIFREYEADLPWITKMILWVSQMISGKIYYFISSGVLLLLLFNILKQSQYFNKELNYLIFSLPLLGKILRKYDIFQFSHTLNALLGNGVSMVKSLEILSLTARSYHLKNDINNMKNFVLRGEKVCDALLRSKIFPLSVAQIMAIGEEAGEMPFVLEKLADHLGKEIDSTVEIYSNVIEPVLILVIGSIVGLILLSIYLPLFNISNIIEG